MPRGRIVAAVIVLALAAGRLTAQVVNPTPSLDGPTAATIDEAPVVAPIAPPPVSVSPVPEPGSILLLGGPAAVGWVMYWRRKWRAPQTPAE